VVELPACPSPAPPIDLKQSMVELLPRLRMFARSLTGDAARADDLVQDTIVKALSNIDRFEPGTNLRAWLFTILRNTFYSDLRKRRREVADSEGEHAARLAEPQRQDAAVDFTDFKRVFAQLSAGHREVLTLIAASDCSYEAAEICGCAVGTIKSRINRARRRLEELLGVEPGSGSSEADAPQLPQGAIAGGW